MDFDIISTSLKKAFDVFKDNLVAYIVAVLILIACACLSILILPILALPPLVYGLYYMCLKGTRGEKVEIKDVFYGFSSGSMFIRSWIGVLGMALPFIVIFGGIFIIILILGAISPRLLVFGMLLYFLAFVVAIVLAIFLYFTLYIYVMTPSENIIYAIKESIRIGKSNIVMTFLTMLIAGLCGILYVTMPLGYIFAAYMLKDSLDPSIRDNS